MKWYTKTGHGGEKLDRMQDKMKHGLYCIWTSFPTKGTGGLPMGYSRQERTDIGRQIYNNEINKSDAAIKYRISEGTLD